MNPALEIGLLVLSVLLTGAMAIILWQHRDLRQMQEAQARELQSSVRELFDRIGNLRVDMTEHFVKKDDLWLDEQIAYRKLDDLMAAVKRLREPKDE